MAKRGDDRRENILQIAEQLVLRQGFTGTSIDDILKHAHITKGGFLYHFPGKRDLAKALIERYLDADQEFFDDHAQRARALSEDPLQQMLIFLNLMAESMGNLPAVHPGCLVATFTYESHQFDDEIHQLILFGTTKWRALFMEFLDAIAKVYRARLDVSHDTLADALTAIIEGGIILSKALDDKQVLVDQLHHYRNYIRLLYGDVREVA